MSGMNRWSVNSQIVYLATRMSARKLDADPMGGTRLLMHLEITSID
jgi:hypothetical protein